MRAPAVGASRVVVQQGALRHIDQFLQSHRKIDDIGNGQHVGIVDCALLDNLTIPD